jgi:septal ring factor EnvC (AmiA/AmiB activator)
MKTYIEKYWKYAVGVVLFFTILYLVVYLGTPKPKMSELDKYKIDQLNKKIEDLKNLQKSLNDSLNVYQQKIDKIDDKISNIKIEKKEINNFYTQKKEEIKSADKKQIDRLLRKRYNY